MKFLILNGPNINMLGVRQPEIYGRRSYDDLAALVSAHAREIGVEIELRQSNHEGELVDLIQSAYRRVDGLIINPAAYTHTSVAIADAVAAVGVPTVEVHISDVTKREAFRQVSYLRPYCVKTIMGRGIEGYAEAMDFLKELKERAESETAH